MAPNENTLTFKEGYWGSYPNMIVSVKDTDLKKFVERIRAISSDADYQVLVDDFGVRRQHADFWNYFDELNQIYKQTSPLEAGVLDLTRYDL